MKRGPKLKARAAGALLLLASCEAEEKPPVLDAQVRPAIERSLAWVGANTPESAHILLFLGVIHNRFGVSSLGGMKERYDAAILAGDRTPDLLAARRIVAPEHEYSVEGLMLLASPINRIHAPALYCDQLELPQNYRRVLKDALRAGDYPMTHAGLALIWMEALGCEPPFEKAEGFRANVVKAMADLLDPGDGLTDIEIEAGAFLNALGEGQLVPPGFLEAVLAAQHPDGSWSHDTVLEPGAHDWHATCLALWYLHEVGIDEKDKRPVLERRP